MSRCLPSSLLLLLFLPLPLQAQGREWSIFASGGVWGYDLMQDSRATASRHRMVYSEVGAELSMRMIKQLRFAPEIGLALAQFSYTYARSADPRNLYSNLDQFSLRLSPGLGFSPGGTFILRFSPCIYIPFLSTGTYRVETFSSPVGYITTINRDSKFWQIRNPVDIGPELNVGYCFLLGKDLRLGLRASAYAGTIPFIRPTVSTPHLPLMRRASLEAVFYFAGSAQKRVDPVD